MTAPTPAPGAPQPPQPGPAPTPQPAPTPAPTPWSPDSLPPEAQAWLKSQVDAADKKSRLTSKENAATEVMKTIATALGLADPAEPTTVEGLAGRLAEVKKGHAEATSRAANAEIEGQVIRAAVRCGANPDAILDSNRLLDQLAAIEADDDKTWLAEVEKVITAAVTANPLLRIAGTAAAPARQGADHTGGSGRTTAGSLDDAVKKAMGG